MGVGTGNDGSGGGVAVGTGRLGVGTGKVGVGTGTVGVGPGKLGVGTGMVALGEGLGPGPPDGPADALALGEDPDVEAVLDFWSFEAWLMTLESSGAKVAPMPAP